MDLGRRLAAACGLLGLGLVVACSGGGSSSTSEDEIGTRPPRAWTPAAPRAGNLRIATFNIRNFPKDTMSAAADAGADASTAPTTTTPDRDARQPLVRKQSETDETMLVDLLERLDFDVLAIQEINEPERFEAMLGRLGERNGRAYQAVFSVAWDHPQNTGLVVRRDRLRIEAPEVHGEIATRPTMRAGLSARVVSTREGGADFGMLVLHLASGDTGGRAALRATQAAAAAEVIAARQAEFGDADFIVVGDLNTAKEEAEYRGLDAAMAGHATGLSRQPNDLGCTSYYVKSPHLPNLVPSTIDHVYVASLEERDRAVPVTAGAHCFERSCQPFESDSKEHGTSYWSVSDHCPVYFEIADEDRD